MDPTVVALPISEHSKNKETLEQEHQRVKTLWLHHYCFEKQ